MLQRAEWLRKQRKKKERARAAFYKYPYKFAKCLFIKEKTGTLKVKVKEHLKNIYSDNQRHVPATIPTDMPPIQPPVYQMDTRPTTWSEVESMVKRARSTSASWKTTLLTSQCRRWGLVVSQDVWNTQALFGTSTNRQKGKEGPWPCQRLRISTTQDNLDGVQLLPGPREQNGRIHNFSPGIHYGNGDDYSSIMMGGWRRTTGEWVASSPNQGIYGWHEDYNNYKTMYQMPAG